MEKFNSVLLIDDDPISQFISKSIVKKLSITEEIHLAANGLEGFHFLNKANTNNIFPELILLDLNMPVLDGFELLKLIHVNFSDKIDQIKIMVLTSSANQNDYEKAFRYSISEYINKPLTEAKLKTALHFKSG